MNKYRWLDQNIQWQLNRHFRNLNIAQVQPCSEQKPNKSLIQSTAFGWSWFVLENLLFPSEKCNDGCGLRGWIGRWLGSTGTLTNEGVDHHWCIRRLLSIAEWMKWIDRETISTIVPAPLPAEPLSDQLRVFGTKFALAYWSKFVLRGD